MITDVQERVFVEEVANGEPENAYVLNIYNGKVSLLADIEIVYTNVEAVVETMNFEMPDSFSDKNVGEAVRDVRSVYAGGIELEPYEDEMAAIRDFMSIYDGLLVRHYLISSEETIESLRRIPDGIAYVYIEEGYNE